MLVSLNIKLTELNYLNRNPTIEKLMKQGDSMSMPSKSIAHTFYGWPD